MDSSKIVFLINDQVRLIKVSYENVAAGTTNSQEYLKQTVAADGQNGHPSRRVTRGTGYTIGRGVRGPLLQDMT